MSYLPAATSKRGDEIRKLQAHLDLLDREEQHNKFLQGDYPKLRLRQIAEERDATKAQITELENLSDDELVERFNPKVERPEGMATAELAGRGAHAPRGVVTQHTPPPVRTYGIPAPVNPIEWARVNQEAATRA